MTTRFRSSIPANNNVIVTPQSSAPASPICEKATPLFKEKTPNLSQQPGCGTDLMRDHVYALTKLTEDALRLIIPFPHFKGYHDFTTLVNEEIKKTTFGGISLEESNRIISGLHQMLYHYENEAELLSMDTLENQPGPDSYRHGNGNEHRPTLPSLQSTWKSIAKASNIKSCLPDYQCPSLNSAVQDLIFLREAATVHAKQNSCDFTLVLRELSDTIDSVRHAYLVDLTTLEKLMETKSLVWAKEYYTEKLADEIDSACPLLSSHRGQNDGGYKKPSMTNVRPTGNETESQLNKLQGVVNENKDLHLQKKEFEGRIQKLEGEIQELDLQKKEFEGQIRRVEAADLDLELKQKGSQIQLQKLEAENQELHLQKTEFDGQIQRLEAENLDLRLQKREYLLQEPQKEASDGQIQKLEAKAHNLDFQMKTFEGQIRRLEAEKLDLNIQKHEFEDQLQKLEAENLELHCDKTDTEVQIQKLEAEKQELETKLKGTLDESQVETGLKGEFDVIVKTLKAENEEWRSMIARLEMEAKEQLKPSTDMPAKLTTEDCCGEEVPDQKGSWSVWKPSS